MKVALGYCTDNKNQIIPILDVLEPLIAVHQFESNLGFVSNNLLQFDGFKLLVISDNFLKSPDCMFGSLELLRSDSDKLMVLVADGIDENQQPVPTFLTKVTHIIKYINYWQDKYLELRRTKSYDEAEIDFELKKIRSISTEVGEFIRILRGMELIDLQSEIAGGFINLSNYLSLKIEVPEPVTPTESPWGERMEAESSSWDDPGTETVITEEPVSEPVTPTESPWGESMEAESSSWGDPGSETVITEEPVSEPVTPTETPWGDSVEAESSLWGDPGTETVITEEPVSEPVTPTETPWGESMEAEASSWGDPGTETVVTEEPVSEPVTPTETPWGESMEAEASSWGDPGTETVITEEPVSEPVTPTETPWGESMEAESSSWGDSGTETVVTEEPVSEPVTPTETPWGESMEAESSSWGDPDNLPGQTETDDVKDQTELNQIQWIQQAEEKIKLGDFLEAENLLKRAEFSASHDSSILFRLSLLYFNYFKNDLELALKYIDRAIALDENNSEFYFHRSLVKEGLDNDVQSIETDLIKAIELNSMHALAMYQLAVLKRTRGLLADAKRLYVQASNLKYDLKSEQNDIAFGVATPRGNVYDIIEDLKTQINNLQSIIQLKNKPVIHKTVLITGATSGIGRATAIQFAEAGYQKLILTGRRLNLLTELKKQIASLSDCEVVILNFDITNRESVEDALFGLPPIDILINNAGKAKGLAPIYEGSYHHWDEMIQTNITGLLYVTRIISAGMVARKSGHIINIGSTAGKEVYPSGNVYCATKFAVDALTKAIRLDLYQHQIRVSQISPGHVEHTEFAKVRFDGDLEKADIYQGFNPLTSDDVAGMILYIANQPERINIQDILVMGTQQAGASFIDRSGRKF
jgi:NADP-dependent 3-hydroxy acid dehydrogenase YdfG